MPKKEPRGQQLSGNVQLFIKMTVWMILFWIVLLGVTLTVTLRFSLSTLQDRIEKVLTATSNSLAESEMIRRSIL